MTSDRDALYRAICLQPDEDVPRLAFADLIEDEGDSFRAAFIRAQVELARVPDYDPFAVKCRQFNPEFVNGWAMAHTLPELPRDFSWHTHAFRRGFPWLAQVFSRPTFLEQLAEVLETTPVRALNIPYRSFDFAAFADSTLLANLRRVEFNNVWLEHDELTRFGYSPYATGLTELRLDLDANRRVANELGLWSFARTPLFARLEVLELSAEVLGPDLLVDALAAAREPGTLRKLVLARIRLTHHDAARLFSLPVVRGLTHLDLSDNKLNSEGIIALVESGVMSGMRMLNLSKTFPGVPGVKALAEASGLAGLRSLDLSANRLGPVAVRTLTESSGIRGLRVLSLKDNPVGASGAKALAACRHLSGLLELDLENAGIDDAGALALAESPHLDGVLRLIVRDRITGRELGEAARTALTVRFGERVTM